ncbi:hypothetical protein L2E82_36592 [Cichorium intybus]|uniref:Uncharacterized protein n=1 Tax=Cichorium intybus TaxID=13427 RepID=A0ACB9ACA1_CICIN|nr:hypothetical protein L2E82_36592 [Cichorium intybus]
MEQSLCQIQNMVPVMLASKISLIITKLKWVKLSLDPNEKEAGEAVKLLLKGYGTGNSSENESENDLVRIAALKLQITSQKALTIERRSIKKLLNQLGEGDGRLQKKQILIILLDVLKKHFTSITSGLVENDHTLQNQDYKYFEKTENEIIPPEQFVCPISLKVMYDPVVIDSGVTFERMWIQRWFDEGHDICPKTGRKLLNFSLTPNTAMKSMISKWCEDNGFIISDLRVDLSTDASTWEDDSSSVISWEDDFEMLGR